MFEGFTESIGMISKWFDGVHPNPSAKVVGVALMLAFSASLEQVVVGLGVSPTGEILPIHRALITDKYPGRQATRDHALGCPFWPVQWGSDGDLP